MEPLPPLQRVFFRTPHGVLLTSFLSWEDRVNVMCCSSGLLIDSYCDDRKWFLSTVPQMGWWDSKKETRLVKLRELGLNVFLRKWREVQARAVHDSKLAAENAAELQAFFQNDSARLIHALDTDAMFNASTPDHSTDPHPLCLPRIFASGSPDYRFLATFFEHKLVATLHEQGRPLMLLNAASFEQLQRVLRDFPIARLYQKATQLSLPLGQLFNVPRNLYRVISGGKYQCWQQIFDIMLVTVMLSHFHSTRRAKNPFSLGVRDVMLRLLHNAWILDYFRPTDRLLRVKIIMTILVPLQ
jgi:hypothetical protein